MTDAPAPIPMRWTGKSFACHPAHIERANRQYTVGEIYRVTNEEERSDVSHNHEFAFVNEAWKTLPDNLLDIYPSPAHLRKRALIDAGYYDEQIIDVGTNAGAERVARAIRAMPGEDFSYVVFRGCLVVIRRPKSQSKRAMGKAQFQASKTAIMGVIANLLGVETQQLQQARAA